MKKFSTLPSLRVLGGNDNGWFLLEAIIIACLFAADYYHWHHLILLSKTLYVVALGWLSLRFRGLTWKSVGLALPANWPRTAAAGLTAGVLMEALELLVTQPTLIRILHKPPDLSFLASLRGSLGTLAVAIGLTWTLAAIGEEVAYRGYLLNRVAVLFPDWRWRWMAGALISSVVFGLAHFAQGWTGIIENIINGGLLAILYFVGGRNLLLPIVAHGVTDTLDSLLIFSGLYPAL